MDRDGGMKIVSEKVLFSPLEFVYMVVDRRVKAQIRIRILHYFFHTSYGMGLSRERMFGANGNDWLGWLDEKGS